MVDAMAGCVWGWPRPSHVVGSAEGKAGCLTKAGPAAGRSAWATIQACTVVASTIYLRFAGLSYPSITETLTVEQRPQRMRTFFVICTGCIATARTLHDATQ